MPHASAPLTPAGRLHLVQRCRHRPIAHVAAEAAKAAGRAETKGARASYVYLHSAVDGFSRLA